MDKILQYHIIHSALKWYDTDYHASVELTGIMHHRRQWGLQCRQRQRTPESRPQQCRSLGRVGHVPPPKSGWREP